MNDIIGQVLQRGSLAQQAPRRSDEPARGVHRHATRPPPDRTPRASRHDTRITSQGHRPVDGGVRMRCDQTESRPCEICDVAPDLSSRPPGQPLLRQVAMGCVHCALTVVKNHAPSPYAEETNRDGGMVSENEVNGEDVSTRRDVVEGREPLALPSGRDQEGDR